MYCKQLSSVVTQIFCRNVKKLQIFSHFCVFWGRPWQPSWLGWLQKLFSRNCTPNYGIIFWMFYWNQFCGSWYQRKTCSFTDTSKKILLFALIFWNGAMSPDLVFAVWLTFRETKTDSREQIVKPFFFFLLFPEMYDIFVAKQKDIIHFSLHSFQVYGSLICVRTC